MQLFSIGDSGGEQRIQFTRYGRLIESLIGTQVRSGLNIVAIRRLDSLFRLLGDLFVLTWWWRYNINSCVIIDSIRRSIPFGIEQLLLPNQPHISIVYSALDTSVFLSKLVIVPSSVILE